MSEEVSGVDRRTKEQGRIADKLAAAEAEAIRERDAAPSGPNERQKRAAAIVGIRREARGRGGAKAAALTALADAAELIEKEIEANETTVAGTLRKPDPVSVAAAAIAVKVRKVLPFTEPEAVAFVVANWTLSEAHAERRANATAYNVAEAGRMELCGKFWNTLQAGLIELEYGGDPVGSMMVRGLEL